MNIVHSHRIHRMIRRWLPLGWRFGITLLLGLLPAVALACTPPPGGLPNYTIAQRVQAADVVLEGTVTKLTKLNIQNDTATITVQRYFKGSGPASVTITNFGSSAQCRSPVRVGDHWIFFAKGSPGALMTASYLSQFDAITAPSADTIAQILAALNIQPRVYLPLLVRGGAQIAAGAPASAYDGALTALIFVGVGAVGVWLRSAAR